MKKILSELIDNSYVNKSDKILVGVSGGADSMLLLCALIEKQKETNFDFKVIHINHHIREKTSDEDAKFVENFCKKHKIDILVVDFDVKKFKTESKIGMEEAARELRYQAFFKYMQDEKLNKLFLAHHKNDQAETVLMHILRGAGVSGACGIKNTDIIKRPFLNLTKAEILELCKTNKIDFVTDETNGDSKYSRNFLRNEVVPLIETKFPKAVEMISAFAKRCDEVQEFVLSNLDENNIIKAENGIIIKQKVFLYHRILIREYIKKAFEKHGVFSDVEMKHYDKIIELASAENNKRIDLPHDIVATKVYDGIKLAKKELMALQNEECYFELGEIKFNNICKIESKIIEKDEVDYGDGNFYCDYDKISNNCVWRTRQDGDLFAKLGAGTKKLNDYFTDKKIEVAKRDKIPLLARGNQILIVLGYDIAENVKITGETDTILLIKKVN